ncbi:MAG: hypothetical protein ABMA02_09260 [Saprospiraceae bacterium]
MKAYSFFSLGVFSLILMFCVFRDKKANVANTPSTTINLVDSTLSVTLQATLSGSTWIVNDASVSSYLSQVALASFSKTLSNFQSISVTVASDYSFAILEGKASDDSGSQHPVGVEYQLTGGGGTTAEFASKDKHTCTGAPCSCCNFKYLNRQVVGCECYQVSCRVEQGGKCNHTVSTTQ